MVATAPSRTQMFLALQKEFQEGQYRSGLALLSADGKGSRQEGHFTLRQSCSPSCFSSHSSSRFLSYMGLFHDLHLSQIAYFGLGLSCVFWYSHALNPLKTISAPFHPSKIANRRAHNAAMNISVRAARLSYPFLSVFIRAQVAFDRKKCRFPNEPNLTSENYQCLARQPVPLEKSVLA